MRLAPEMEITTRTQLRAFLRFHAASFKFGGAMQLVSVGQKLTMSSREIVDYINSHREKLAIESGSCTDYAELRHSDFMRKCLDVLGEGVRNFSDTLRNEQNGQTYGIYRFPKREACLMAMSYSYELQAIVYDRWQELESGQTFQVPTTLSGALRLAAEQAEVIEQQSAQLAIAAPKVEFFDKVVERGTLMTATQVGQKLGLSAVTLNKHLDSFDVYSKGVKRGRVFKQWVIDKAYGELKQTELGFSQPLFTTAGEAWIVEKLTGEGVI